MFLNIPLNNGIRLVIDNMNHLKSATIGVYFGVGSRDEIVSNNGISHFMEHMMFKGTENYTSKELVEEIEALGAYVNAYTSTEKTAYYIKTPSDSLLSAANLLYEMVYKSTFNQDLIDGECKVVLEEIARAQDDPSDLAYEALMQQSFAGNPLGRDILGTEDILVNIKQKDMLDYFTNNYTTDNTVISIAGNFSMDDITSIIELFETIPASKHTKNRIKPTFNSGVKVVRKEVEQANLRYGFEGVSLFSDKTYAIEILSNILGGMSSRLFQEVREKRGLAYSVSSYSTEYSDTGMLGIYAGTTLDKYQKTHKIILNVIESLISSGVTDKEFALAKAKIKGSYTIHLEDTKSIMTWMGLNKLQIDTVPSIDEEIQKILSVTKQEVEDLAKEIFTKPYSLGLVINDTSEEIK